LYWQITDNDLFTKTAPKKFFKTQMKSGKEADKYGTWYSSATLDNKKALYSMGGANKAPLQIFLA